MSSGPPCTLDGETPPFRVMVRLPGHQTSISPVVRGLMEVVRATPCAVGKEFEIETALREALANAVVHGCGNDPSAAVDCGLSCSSSGTLVMVVRDSGPGFDPASVPDPVAGDNLYSSHGRGIYLIKRMMDDVWFERGGREIHMRRSSSAAPSPPTTRPW